MDKRVLAAVLCGTFAFPALAALKALEAVQSLK